MISLTAWDGKIRAGLYRKLSVSDTKNKMKKVTRRGKRDYTKLRKKLFLKETVETLYRKIKKGEGDKK